MLSPRRLRLGALALGAALTVALVPLSRVSGDQLNMLSRGWLLAARGQLIPFGIPNSIGGHTPGPFTAWIVGLPLALASDFRAPIVLVALSHLAALLLLERATRDAFTPLERAAFAVLYALLPWRVEASATLWNANYLFFVGAVHLATSRALARAPRFWPTFFHVAALGFGAQLHPSVFLLGVHSLLLLARRRVHLDWRAFAAGTALVGATLVPWFAPDDRIPGLFRDSAESHARGFPFRGLVLVFPLLKGLSFWLRYPSVAIARESKRFDFSERFGAGVDAWLGPSVVALVAFLAVVTVAVALAANVAFFRGRFLALVGASEDRVEPHRWLESYAALALVAMALTFAATPTTPQSWQAFPLVHASVLPLAFAVSRFAERRGERSALRVLAAVGAIFLITDLALAFGAPSFRCHGRGTLVFPLRAHSPMFDELGLQRACPWPLGAPDGWWPDVLPEE